MANNQDTRNLVQCVTFINDDTPGAFIPVDRWMPKPDDAIVHFQKGVMYAPISAFSGVFLDPEMRFDYFTLAAKKCYNSPAMREHLYQYINYYETFYDRDKEYLAILFRLKTFIDKNESCVYNQDYFFNDMDRYILKSSIETKVAKMVEDNYKLDLNYTNAKSPSLMYTNQHAKILLKMSILMDLCIPLLTHYAYMHKVENIDEYLMCFYDKIFRIYIHEADMYTKLYDTAYTNIAANQKNNIGIWIKQDIRAVDVPTHSSASVKNIILNIMPRYSFEQNIISFNFASIRQTTGYAITDVSFEYNYISISSSRRDEDSVSDFD